MTYCLFLYTAYSLLFSPPHLQFSTVSELAGMAKDLERCSSSPGSVIREFKDGHLKVQQAVVMMVPSRSMLNGPWRITSTQIAASPDFQKVQVLSGLRKMVIAFDQVILNI